MSDTREDVHTAGPADTDLTTRARAVLADPAFKDRHRSAILGHWSDDPIARADMRCNLYFFDLTDEDDRWTPLGVEVRRLLSEDADFHGHLDACEQCREHPFALCSVGARLLSEGTDR